MPVFTIWHLVSPSSCVSGLNAIGLNRSDDQLPSNIGRSTETFRSSYLLQILSPNVFGPLAAGLAAGQNLAP